MSYADVRIEGLRLAPFCDGQCPLGYILACIYIHERLQYASIIVQSHLRYSHTTTLLPTRARVAVSLMAIPVHHLQRQEGKSNSQCDSQYAYLFALAVTFSRRASNSSKVRTDRCVQAANHEERHSSTSFICVGVDVFVEGHDSGELSLDEDGLGPLGMSIDAWVAFSANGGLVSRSSGLAVRGCKIILPALQGASWCGVACDGSAFSSGMLSAVSSSSECSSDACFSFAFSELKRR